MPPGDAPFDGSFDQFEGYSLRLGAETGIFFATFKVVRGGVGLDLQRVVESLISPKRELTESTPLSILAMLERYWRPTRGRSSCPPCVLNSFVDDEGTSVVRSGSGIFQQELDSAPVYLFVIPPGLREEPSQALRLGRRCAPTTGSVLARAVSVLLRSAGSSKPSR